MSLSTAHFDFLVCPTKNLVKMYTILKQMGDAKTIPTASRFFSMEVVHELSRRFSVLKHLSAKDHQLHRS